jgi:hypothetical protein
MGMVRGYLSGPLAGRLIDLHLGDVERSENDREMFFGIERT